MVKSYRDLEVWRLGLDLVQTIYLCTAQFPKSETYGLASQMRCAAVSVPSNIAEGQARNSTLQFLQFISIALGSLAELETQLELASRLDYGGAGIRAALSQAQLLGRKLRCLQSALKAKGRTNTNHQPPVTSHL
jgi:four helix bundle protein